MSIKDNIPRFRLFAGPNGSGKSTLIEEIQSQFSIGYFINADVIEEDLKKNNFLNISSYLSETTAHSDWINYCQKHKEDPFLSKFHSNHIEISSDGKQLICTGEINSYAASFIASFFRNILASNRQSFSFETVMSHRSKIDFLEKMKLKGYKTYLYFICTMDPQINVERVLKRVKKGGHNVDNQKIIDRYYKSLSHLNLAFKISDRAYVIDSTSLKNSIILEKKDDKLIFHNKSAPEWVMEYLLKFLTNKN
ncbi:MAG: zeta toxin family protein [Bacteroidota bacterium]